ncbi:MAG: Asp-tRNA(Asn)/Glu-tRNA(Gln) amidotransferase subunit GatC [Desulfocapsaceae bacterium]|nr:Asp-tRNA(Asn)/Glu-tRNA(Gln) amidotransferase subunit GatC [Desulfocapsaceae bacterium]
MKISRQEVEHVAHLARLNLSEDDLVKMTGQLDEILNYVAKLEELDTTDIEPTTHAFSVKNAYRDDIAQESLTQEESLRNCAVRNNEAFIVPRIL